MTIDKREIITVPKWVVILLSPMIISGIIAYAAHRFDAGKQEKINEVTMEAIKSNDVAIKELKLNEVNTLQNTKVDRNEFVIIRDQMDRIENKIDKHMAK